MSLNYSSLFKVSYIYIYVYVMLIYRYTRKRGERTRLFLVRNFIVFKCNKRPIKITHFIFLTLWIAFLFSIQFLSYIYFFILYNFYIFFILHHLPLNFYFIYFLIFDYFSDSSKTNSKRHLN